MKKILNSFWIGIILALVDYTKSFACGGCADYRLDAGLPFLRLWMPIFLIWLIGRLLFWLIGKFKNISLPLTYSKQPWSSLIKRIILFVVIFVFTAGSITLPFLLIILPTLFLSISTSFKKLKQISPKHILQKTFLIFQWGILATLILLIPYSIILCNSPKWLLERLRYPPFFPESIKIEKRLIAQGKKAIPEIKAFIENFDEKSSRSRNVYSSLMSIVRQLGDASLAIPVADVFNRIQYENDIYFDDVIVESAKTICVLDKKLAAEIIQEKIIDNFDEINLVSSKVYSSLMPVVRQLGDTSLAIPVANVFNRIQYKKNIYFVDVVIELAKTICVLDKKLAAKVIPEKIIELKNDPEIPPVHFLEMFGSLIESVIRTKNQDVIRMVLSEENMDIIIENTKNIKYIKIADSSRAVFKILGAPFYDKDSEAYKKWWQENKERILNAGKSHNHLSDM
ncbi:MAG: hypothetical protein ABH952_11705 [Candidatus Omnitrophota bacterium]